MSSLVRCYLSTLPVTVTTEVKYDRMLPLWYYCMVRFGTKFRETVLAIREGMVSLKIHPERPASPASAHLVRQERKHKGRTGWEGHMTNPDTVVFCRVDEERGTLESLDEIRCPYLKSRGRFVRNVFGGLLTSVQHASLPKLYQGILDNVEVPVLIFSDAASVWFDDD